jgi:hypothetical protein
VDWIKLAQNKFQWRYCEQPLTVWNISVRLIVILSRRTLLCVVAGCCYKVVSYKASHLLRHFSDLFWSSPEFLFIYQSSLVASEIPTSKAGCCREIPLHLADVLSLSHSAGTLTWRQTLGHGTDGFTSPPKQDVLRIFIALKNLSPTGGVS